MTLSDLTNNIYIFNLKRRTDRREHIISEMDKIDCKNYQIIEAVDGRKINNNSRLKNGAFGLIMSYILLYDTIKDIPYDNILIIEDDCVFYENFNVLLSKYISQVPSDWDILYFGANHNYHIGYKTKIINDNVVKLENSYSAHCVLLKKQVFMELIEELKTFTMECDVALAKLQKKYNSYSSSIPLTSQLPNFSDIENKEVDYNWLIK